MLNSAPPPFAFANTFQSLPPDGPLLHFVNTVQSAVGAYVLGDIAPEVVIARVCDAVGAFDSARDIIIARSIVADICLRIAPAATQINQAALRGLLTASRPQAIVHCLTDLCSGLRAVSDSGHMHGAALTCSRLVAAIRSQALDRSITLTRVAATCDVSKSHAAHVFRACRNSTFRDELRIARIDRAEELLATNDLSLKEVAYRCGYRNNTSLFARHFKSTIGLSPTAFRQQLQTTNSTP